jgi:hypothetical protein
MFNYTTLSPNRQAFINKALEIYPDLDTTITSDQVQAIANAGFPYPQWFTVPENRISRGIYNFPKPNQTKTNTVEETDQEISNRISDTYESMETLIASVAANTVNSLIIAGAPGLGKSFTVNKVLNEVNNGSEFNYVFHKGYLRATHLFRLLWENRFQGQTIVLDDTDAIFGDETALNILKAALELKTTRRIGWGSEKEFIDEDGEVIPRYFDYEGSVIFLTNLPIRDMIANGSKNAPHLSALESRSLVLDLKIKTRREYIVKINQTIEAGMLSDKGFSKSEETEIVTFVNDNMDKLTELSLRMVEKIAALYRANPSNWVKLVKTVCFK